MQFKKWRFIFAGSMAIAFGAIFFVAMWFTASSSTDPKGVMEIAGQAAGVLAGIGVVMILVGVFKKEVPPGPGGPG